MLLTIRLLSFGGGGRVWDGGEGKEDIKTKKG